MLRSSLAKEHRATEESCTCSTAARFCRDRPVRGRQKSSMAKLTPTQIRQTLRTVPKWTQKGRLIQRTYQFKDFPAAIKFVNAIARAAEKAWQPPDIDIRWNKVTLALTTHDEGGLTEKDFALAQKFDHLK